MDDIKPDLRGFSFLIIEANPSSIIEAEKGLGDFGADIFATKDYIDAADVLAHQHIHVVIAYINLVDENYIYMINDYKKVHPESLFYVLVEDNFDHVEASESLARFVIDDYIKKPIEFTRFAKMVEARVSIPKDKNNTSLAVVKPLIKKVKPYFIFRSSIMQRILANLPQIAASNQTVLVTGETGSGKEIVARAIHVLSERMDGPFVPLNCGAIPDSLVESELFGHEKGAFTSAFRTKKGRFESADNGTLFLDEIGDMPLNLQIRLLRVLEEGQVFRVGSESPIPINVRVVAATRVDLEKAVEDKLFREDLYYRLNVLRLNLPPLRERKDDISLLAVHFLERAFTEMSRVPPFPLLSLETIYFLEQYPWKGNVRELRNTMIRIATMLPPNTKRIFPFHILPHLKDKKQMNMQPDSEKAGSGVFIPTGYNLAEAEDLIIKETLKQTGGNKSKAASLLGINVRTLRRKLNAEGEFN